MVVNAKTKSDLLHLQTDNWFEINRREVSKMVNFVVQSDSVSDYCQPRGEGECSIVPFGCSTCRIKRSRPQDP
jgi:hypothetical protein